MATFGELITRTLTRLSAAGGLDVQTYMQPKIAEMLQHKFDIIFDKRFWRDFKKSNTYTLDATTGLITADITNEIKRFIDIEYVWLDGYDAPLPEKPADARSSRVNLQCFEPYGDASKRFRVLPITTGGLVEVSYRTKPAPFTEDDVVPMDDHLLITGTCYDWLVGEGANIEDAKKFKQMFDARYEDLVKLEMKNEKSLYSPTLNGVDRWFDV